MKIPTIPSVSKSAQAYEGPTLLESILNDVLIMTIEAGSVRERVTANLSPLATRGLFLATDDLSNAELLRILHTETANIVFSRDTKEARNLRSIGSERSLKLGVLRMHSLELLKSGKIGKADVVRAWTYAIIHEASRQAVDEARKTHPVIDMNVLKVDPALANQILNRSYQLIPALIQDEFTKASEAESVGQPFAKERMFLHFAAMEVVRAMDLPVNPLAAMKSLLDHVYPELEQYAL